MLFERDPLTGDEITFLGLYGCLVGFYRVCRFLEDMVKEAVE